MRSLIPKVKAVFDRWRDIADQPFFGLTSNGSLRKGLFRLKREAAPCREMARAANNVLCALTAKEKARAQKVMNSSLWQSWQNTEIFVDNHGLRLEYAAKHVRALVLEVIRTSLSDQGYQNAIATMHLNGFLGELLGAPGVLNEWSYNFCIYGEPSANEPWGWQLFGHHLALNCVSINGQMVLTPCFMGAEVNIADRGRFKGQVMFQDEERLGLELMNSLPSKFQEKAIVGRTLSGHDLPDGRIVPGDFLTLGGAYQDNRVVPYEGIVVSKFDKLAQTKFLGLVNAYIGNLPDGPRESKMEDFEYHLSETHFCWIGGFGPSDPFYYRVQSPVIFIEFDHHPGVFLTNTEALKFHVHTVVRTPNGNDYGIDLLRQHYRASHSSEVLDAQT